MIAQSSEFENMAVREEELPELDRLLTDACPFDARGGPENKHGKVCVLIQVRNFRKANIFFVRAAAAAAQRTSSASLRLHPGETSHKVPYETPSTACA